jgi:hypothetical protein
MIYNRQYSIIYQRLQFFRMLCMLCGRLTLAAHHSVERAEGGAAVLEARNSCEIQRLLESRLPKDRSDINQRFRAAGSGSCL